MKYLKRFNENFNQDELLTESIIGKIFDRLGYTDEVLRKSIKDTLNVDENSSKEEIIQKTKELFNGSDNKRKLLKLVKTLGVFGEIITSLVVLFNVPWSNWTWFGTFIYMLLSHRENNLIRKPFKDIMKNGEFFNEDLKRFNENNTSLPFRSDLLYKDSNLGKYELYVDGSTGWGIIFPNGYMEVEEGPHESVGFMNGEINGVSIGARGNDVPRIPGEYWEGNMSSDKLSRFFDSVISRYNNITESSDDYKDLSMYNPYYSDKDEDYKNNLLKWYMKGFNDELNGTSTVESDNKIDMVAYDLGAQHAVIGDDVSSIDNLSDEEIISMIEDWNNPINADNKNQK